MANKKSEILRKIIKFGGGKSRVLEYDENGKVKKVYAELMDLSGRKQVVGVAGGSIEPTEISVELFKNAVEFRKFHLGKKESLAKMNLSKMKYNTAWKYAVLAQNAIQKEKGISTKNGG